MIANYHTHTWRCGHAAGEERAYVEQAIQSGLKILGFSDHTPMPFDGGYQSSFRMRLDQFEGYVDTVLDLKREYQNEIEIHLGVEAEYYPAYFSRLQNFLQDYPVEYLLLGQHYLGNEIHDHYNGSPTGQDDHLIRYCEQAAEALRTGAFTYFAHPDLIYYTGDPGLYETCMRKLCETAKEEQIPLEINCLGILEHRHYPRDQFWKIAGEVGNTVILGSDAHRPENVWRAEVVQTGEQTAASNHLKLIDTVEFRKPF